LNIAAPSKADTEKQTKRGAKPAQAGTMAWKETTNIGRDLVENMLFALRNICSKKRHGLDHPSHGAKTMETQAGNSSTQSGNKNLTPRTSEKQTFLRIGAV